MLAITMTWADSASLLVLVLASSLATAATHCAPREIDYFTCKIRDSGKVISLCGVPFRDSPNAAAEIRDTAWIQYRFGKPGRLELIYPAKKSPLLTRFTAEYIVANDRHLYVLMFKIGGYKYEIQSSPGLRGVVVEKGTSRAVLPCDGEPKTTWAKNLNSFYELVQILSREGPAN